MKKAVVIGAGVVGLFTAKELLERDFEVVVIDSGEEGSSKCSTGNAGMIVPSHFVPIASPAMLKLGISSLLKRDGPFGMSLPPNWELLKWITLFMKSATRAKVERVGPVLAQMHLLSKSIYQKLGESLDFDLTERGLLAICSSQHALEEEATLEAPAKKLGLSVEVYDRAALAKADPGVTMEAAGAVHFKEDAHLDPNNLVNGLESYLRSKGCQFLNREVVTGFKTESRVVTAVITDKSEVPADIVILAAGSWTGDLAKMLGQYLPLQGGKGYSFDIPNPVQMPAICSLLIEARVAVTPMSDRLRFSGTMEIVGRDLSINQKRLGGLQRSIPKYFPKFTKESLGQSEVWSGLRPCSPDGMPFIGKTINFDNAIINSGHSMMGLSLAPVSGLIAAQIAVGDEPSVPMTYIRADRKI